MPYSGRIPPSSCGEQVRSSDIKRVAVFIDGDNVSASYGQCIVEQAKQHGRVDICHVYGNAQTQDNWSEVPFARFIYAGCGKNGADLLLALDAMDLCVPRAFETVVLASSDADFAHLAHRLRARGCNVIGMGAAQASQALSAACSEFYTLKKQPVVAPVKPVPSSVKALDQARLHKLDRQIRSFFDLEKNRKKSLRLNAVAQFVKCKYDVTIATMGFTNWRAYFEQHSTWYEISDAPAGSKDRDPLVRRMRPTALACDAASVGQAPLPVAAE